MDDLSADEKDLLNRVKVDPALEALFFRKAKGLKWFDPLNDAGYFAAEKIPSPVPAKEKGYVNVPRWGPIQYLVETAPELVDDQSDKYAPCFLTIIMEATEYARERQFGSYHVWWQFSKIITIIPTRFIHLDFIDVVNYWLDDIYETGLVAANLGEKWLVRLLGNDSDSHSLELAVLVIESLYKVNYVERDSEPEKYDAFLRFNAHYAKKITEKTANTAGQRLGYQAVKIYQNRLEDILRVCGNDRWSSMWQPAIEDHEQNKYHDKAENLIIKAYRECLLGYFEYNLAEASEHCTILLTSEFQVVQRIAIHIVTQHHEACRNLTDTILDVQFLQSNYQHEFWCFIHSCYGDFDETQRAKLLDLISGQSRQDSDGKVLVGATAYEQAGWLEAIKDYGARESKAYQDALAISGSVPEHPSFSSYMSSGWYAPKSPYQIDELSSLSTLALVGKLATFEETGGWCEPSLEGLASAVKQLFVEYPLRYYTDLSQFAALDLHFAHAIIEAYKQLWTEKASLPWDDIWGALLSFSSEIINNASFWHEEVTPSNDSIVANSGWLVSSLARLLEAGAKSDDHAFNSNYHGEVESLIAAILTNKAGEEFTETTDAVSLAINSPRGQCLEALINLTLRCCRLEDKLKGQHSETWRHFEPYFEFEFSRAKQGEYEFATLVTNYLPNFLYMSGDWIIQNLPQIFDRTDYQKWLCAMQGYSYVGKVYDDIYQYLKSTGDYLAGLDDKNLIERVDDRFIQHIFVAYLNDFECLDDEAGLLKALIDRKNTKELSQLIWFVGTFGRNAEVEVRDKVYRIWTELIGILDITTKEGRQLASSLCTWAVFVDVVDQERKDILLRIAPYADESHHAYSLLENLARLSKKQPREVNEIWQRMLTVSVSDYPDDAVREMLKNLLALGLEGRRLANETVSKYLEKGADRPRQWLREIEAGSNS